MCLWSKFHVVLFPGPEGSRVPRNRFCQHYACGAGCIHTARGPLAGILFFPLPPPDIGSIQPRHHKWLSKRTACSQTHHKLSEAGTFKGYKNNQDHKTSTHYVFRPWLYKQLLALRLLLLISIIGGIACSPKVYAGLSLAKEQVEQRPYKWNKPDDQ